MRKQVWEDEEVKEGEEGELDAVELDKQVWEDEEVKESEERWKEGNEYEQGNEV
jgi:hypothetical protein